MGYFSNGTEGMDYEERFCSRCVNWRDNGDGRGYGCPIIDLHSLWNYDAVGEKADKAKTQALNHFIPRTGLYNDQCVMFQEAKPETFKYCSKCENPSNSTIEKIEGNLCVLCAEKLEQNLLKK